MLLLVSRLISGFHIEGFWNAVAGALSSAHYFMLNWFSSPVAASKSAFYRH